MQKRMATEVKRTIYPINIYAWGDPQETDAKKWTARAKLVAAAILGIAGGYLWAVFQ
ncbi:MAG: hypothetical protein LBQ00_06710 [Syntrophobacterales bacterium]|jgi:hypothetical protein|nr:hypothetical protein [Syntrophobacterales bacterium]